MNQARNESRTLYFIIAVLSAGILVNQCSQARAQEGVTATVATVNAAEQTWRRAAILVPGPMTPRIETKAVSEAPRPRQDPILKIVEGSSRCRVDWHSQRAKRPSRISCWR